MDETQEEVRTLTVYRDKIAGFHGSWQSGLATLEFESGRSVVCENAQTVRCMDAAFGGVITENHCVNQEAIRGKDIVWSYDELGLVLGGFSLAEDWCNALPEIGGQVEIALEQDDSED